MRHAATDVGVAMAVACLLPACTLLVSDTEPELTPSILAAPSGAPPRDRAEPSGSIEQLLREGQHPLAQAVPGSERILLSVERSRGFTFPMPEHRKDEYLWLVLRCTQPVPLSLVIKDGEGYALHQDSLVHCPATDLVLGPLDTQARHGLLTIPAGSTVHLTQVSATLDTAGDRADPRYPRRFLR